MAVMALMPKRPTPLAMAPLVLRPPVAVGRGLLVVDVKLEISELTELMREEREEMEEESPELDGVGDDTEDDTEVVVVLVMDSEDGIKEPPKVEVGGEVDVTGGRLGMEVGFSRQTLVEPGLTVITGVSLPSPLESPRTITISVPPGIVTRVQVNEVPVTLVKTAAI